MNMPTTSKIHHLKVQPEFFHAVRMKRKTFEIRYNEDRHFQVGDILELMEWDNETEQYTGESERRVVVFITEYKQQDGYVVLGMK